MAARGPPDTTQNLPNGSLNQQHQGLEVQLSQAKSMVSHICSELASLDLKRVNNQRVLFQLYKDDSSIDYGQMKKHVEGVFGQQAQQSILSRTDQTEKLIEINLKQDYESVQLQLNQAYLKQDSLQIKLSSKNQHKPQEEKPQDSKESSTPHRSDRSAFSSFSSQQGATDRMRQFQRV